jgi:hypothetical protein
MAFHQPLLPVLPVARELLSKTKWMASSSKIPPQIDFKGPPPKLPRAKVLSVDDDTKLDRVCSRVERARSKSPHWRKGSSRKFESATPSSFTNLPLTDEPDSLVMHDSERSNDRKGLKSLFTRGAKSDSTSVSDDRG